MKPGKRGSTTPFAMLGRKLLRSEEWVAIGKVGRDIYTELKLNYNGYNNGKLIATYGYLRKKYTYGFGQLSKGYKLLEKHGLIVRTQIGELEGLSGKKPNTFKLTGKLELLYEKV